MNNFLKTLIVSSLIAYAANAQNAVVSAVVETDQRTNYRIDAFIRDGLKKWTGIKDDIFITYDEGRFTFNKVRMQLMPLSYGNLNLGIAGQLINGKKHVSEAGIVGNISVKDTINNLTAKLEMQYYPKSKKIEPFGFIKFGKFGLDILAQYVFNVKTMFARIGTSYDIGDLVGAPNDRIFIGPELKISNQPKQPIKNAYTGLRIGVRM